MPIYFILLLQARRAHEKRSFAIAPERKQPQGLEAFIVVLALVQQAFKETDRWLVKIVIHQLNVAAHLLGQIIVVGLKSLAASFVDKPVIKISDRVGQSEIVFQLAFGLEH